MVIIEEGGYSKFLILLLSITKLTIKTCYNRFYLIAIIVSFISFANFTIFISVENNNF